MMSGIPEDERRRHRGSHIGIVKTGSHAFGSTMRIGLTVVDQA